MNERELLLKKIDEKESQLSKSRRESESWNSGRIKQSGIAQVSKIFVQSLEKEIKKLNEELRKLEK